MATVPDGDGRLDLSAKNLERAHRAWPSRRHAEPVPGQLVDCCVGALGQSCSTATASWGINRWILSVSILRPRSIRVVVKLLPS
jgi:hypothetical protein